MSQLLLTVGSRWKRNPPGREVVEVRRIWHADLDDCLKVRAHPVRGGKDLVACTGWFLAHYTLLSPP